VRITATIQARVGSSRLPGKVLKTVRGRPLLQIQIERVLRSRLVDDVIVATTDNPNDDPIAALADRLGVGCYRGPEDDVLGRIVGLIKAHDVDLHVELIGDSPLTDPQIVDEIVGVFLKAKGNFDYVSNGTSLSYPSGMEVNVYPGAVLIDADNGVAHDDPLREHVDIHISKNDKYRRHLVVAPRWFQRPDLFLEVDTPRDFEMMSALIGYFLDRNNRHFGLGQIIDYLDCHPEIAVLNRDEPRRWWAFKDAVDAAEHG
jgi:spore coat polysaccharide biosynthesis protein SpsF